MKKLFLLSAATIALLFSACSKEELGGGLLSNETISASIADDAPQTRTTLNNQLQVVWSADDAISVFAQNGETYSNNKGTMSSGAGTTDATFSVVIEGTSKVVAAYPYMAATSYDGSKLAITMPDTYTYSENGISGAPMAALISDQNANIAFKNAGALMGLTVNNIPAGYNKAILTSKGEEALTGACEITFDANGNPTLAAAASASGKVITVNFTASETITNKTFFFPIPVDEYSSLELSISNGTKTTVLKTKALNAQRSIRYKTTLTLDEVSGSTPVDASSAADATSKLAAGSNSVNVTISEGETEPTISLPASDNSTSLSFESIPAGKTVTIQATTAEANVSDNVNILASSDENSNNSFNINLPNSTVSLNASGESATYSQVTAHTAANTLIIGKGVTVSNLIVKGGNVRVQGTVSAISRVEGNTDEVTYLIYEEGAKIPESLNENIVAVSAAEWDLRKAIAAGGEITLASDIEVTEMIQVVNDVTINLNGKKLSKKTTTASGKNVLFYVNGSGAKLTIDGEGQVNVESGKTDIAIWAAQNTEVLIKSGNFYGVGCATSSDLIYAQNGKITVEGGSFKLDTKNTEDFAEEQYALLNASGANQETAQDYIVVKGGKFYGFDPANNVSEGVGTNFVAPGYSSVANGEYYEVKEGVCNETALKAAIAADGEITLASDIEVTEMIQVVKEVTINLNGKKLSKKTTTASGKNVLFYVNGSGAKLTIDGEGQVNVQSGKTDIAIWAAQNTEVLIKSGDFHGIGCATSSDLIYAQNGKITVEGGSFKLDTKNTEDFAEAQYALLNASGANQETAQNYIVVKGGKFYDFDPANNASEGAGTNFVAPGYSSVQDGEYYEVKEGVCNETALKAAIAAGGDITLASDIEITSAIQISNTVAINLGEYEIKNATSTSSGKCQVFLIRDGGNLTIDGNGTINAAATCQSVKAVWLYDGGTVNIKGGTFKQAGVESHGSELIYVQKGDLNISGGTFIQSYTVPEISNSYAAVNCLDANYKNGTAKVSITGGTFHKFNPANNVSEGANTNFVAAGYESTTTDEGNTYVVTASTEN